MLSASDQKLFDDVVTNAIDILRLSAKQRADVLRRLQKIEAEMVKRLSENNLGKFSRRDVEKFLASTGEMIDEAYGEIPDSLNLDQTGRVVSDASATSLEVALGIDAVSLPKPDYFKSLASEILIQGAPQVDWWRAQSEALKHKFKVQVRQGLANSETNEQIISRIVGSKEQAGIMPIARRDAASLVQTSVQSVANDARRATFQANRDVIKGLRQVSTLDSHTSIICVAYSGAEWDLDYKPINGNKLPFNSGTPRHFKCRSVETPITKTFAELGLPGVPEPAISTRASSSGQIAQDASFNNYLIRMGPEFQDEVLGKGRAQLWRDGKLTLDQLVSGEGNPLSLSELQRKYGKDFKFEVFSDSQLKGLEKKVVQPYNTGDELYKHAPEGQAQFEELMGKVGKTLGLRTDLKPSELIGEALASDDGFLFIGKLKAREGRATEKVMNDYKGHWEKLADIIRGTISVKTPAELKKAIDTMLESGIKLAQLPKNKFAKPTLEHYRDVLTIVKLPNGMLAEVQFHLKGMTQAKDKAHKYYEVTRRLQGKYDTEELPTPNWSKADAETFYRNFEPQLLEYNKAWRTVAEENGS